MRAAIPFPDIDPELFTIGIGDFAFSLRWYALAYIVGLLVAWWMVAALMRRPALWPGERAPMAPGAVEGLLTWAIIGVILGGRLGFVLFYQPGYYLTYPAEILRIWAGGMSFHGGFLGVVIATVLYSRRHGVPLAQLADAVALAAPPGLFLGRIANFINAELWGRPSDLPWAVIFPGPRAQACPPAWDGPCARHPTQIYEAGLEGLALGLVLAWLVLARGWLKTPGQTAGAFFTGYGAARFFVEFFRVADPQFITPDNPLGHVVRLGSAGLSMGQLLSLPMILGGLVVIWLARRRGRVAGA